MVLLLVIPLALGWVLSRYWLRFEYRSTAWCAGPALGLISTLAGCNLFYRFVPFEPAVNLTLALQAIATVLLWRFRPPPSEQKRLSTLTTQIMAFLSLLVVLYTNAFQIAHPDDDYWIHTPLQGLLRNDTFPPTNPFFSDIPMNGHYGRNLGTAVVSYLSGQDIFLTQHVLTSAIQLATLWLFFSAILHSSGIQGRALLGAFFLYFGINAGGRTGLLDTIQNNNSFVHLYLSILCLLVVTIWRWGRWPNALVTGLVLGSYAIVYETHYGLVFLTVLGVTPLLLAAGIIDRRKAVLAGMALLVSLPLAFTQGGPLTEILARKFQPKAPTSGEISKGMLNQAQIVKIKFPKKELFQILLETGEYQRTSYIYQMDTPLRNLSQPSADRGYSYIWSWKVLKIHFLPLYLAPLSAFLLWRRKSLAGLFLGAFGTIAYLVPALVNFGPIYESEYFRWQFAAALGLAGALGIALSSLFDQIPGRAFYLSGSNLVIGVKGRKVVLVTLLTCLNCVACFTLASTSLAPKVTAHPADWLYFPSTRRWLSEHRMFRFGELDYQAATWLRDRVLFGQNLLVNFPQENNFSLLLESTLTGITGARCVGHALPLENEKIGTTPYRRSPAAQLFWHTFRPEPLAQLKVDWLYYQTHPGSQPPAIPGATLLKEFEDSEKKIAIYRVEREKLPDLNLPAEPPRPAENSAASLVITQPYLRGGTVAQAALKINAQPSTTLQGTMLLSTVRQTDALASAPGEDLRLRIEGKTDSSGRAEVTVPFVVPYYQGPFKLKGVFYPDQGSDGLSINEASFESCFETALESIALESVVFPGITGPLPPRRLLLPRARLRLPNNLPQQREVLASWAFYSLDREEFDVPPIDHLQELKLRRQFSDLPLVTPEKPGTYRLSLYLSSRQGMLTRVLGIPVEVR